MTSVAAERGGDVSECGPDRPAAPATTNHFRRTGRERFLLPARLSRRYLETGRSLRSTGRWLRRKLGMPGAGFIRVADVGSVIMTGHEYMSIA